MQVCQRRQQVLLPDRDPPLQLSVVLDEAVLRRQLADEDVARGQVRHLLEAAQWPHVTLQVLPFRAGLPPVTAGSFSVLESLATRAADVVYLENKTRIFFLESEVEVHGYAREFELVAARALDVGESQELLRSLL